MCLLPKLHGLFRCVVKKCDWGTEPGFEPWTCSKGGMSRTSFSYDTANQTAEIQHDLVSYERKQGTDNEQTVEVSYRKKKKKSYHIWIPKKVVLKVEKRQ